MAFVFDDCRNALLSAGTQIDSALAMVGGTKSDYWLTTIATTLNIPLMVPKVGDFGAALGAARLGMMATTDVRIEIATMPSIAKTIHPDAALHQAFTDTHARGHAAFATLKDL